MLNEQSGGRPCSYNSSIILEVASLHICIGYETQHNSVIKLLSWHNDVVVFCCVLSCVCVFYFHSNMYIHLDDLSEVLHKYFLYRCRNCVLFSLKVGVWVWVWVWVGVCVGGWGWGWVGGE